ncbi:PQQ-binding-like beta-propeller repeat protein [Kitasatospora sp. NPDC101183]|uniref:outer membrane protein assembly factor BamB family protein n=1 Tax=Kitasatospora sp. NPDC101183 TaxID=3364100 RepID=UPI00381C171F
MGVLAVRVLAGRYALVRFVGRGGMGEVWEGRDRMIERRVAVKLLPHEKRDDAGAALFFREARTAGALQHPGVVTVHDLGQDEADGSLFLVMEFVEGRNLAAVLHEDGPPPVASAVEWAAQAAAALARAHDAGIVHRDLKPANLMLTTEGRVKVLDFGIARFMESTNRSSKVMGTLAYMPPERFEEHPGDARSDLYSFGCVLHELLTGKPLFEASSPISMMNAHLFTAPTRPGGQRAGIPADLDDLVLALLAKDPADRPATAEDVHRRLAALTRHRTTAPAPVPAPPPGPDHGTPKTGAEGRPPQAPSPGRRRFLRLAAGATVAIGGGIAAALPFTDRGAATDDPGQAVGTSPSTGISPSTPLRPQWPFATGGFVTAAPAVVGGVVYVGSYDKNLYALDAASGTRKWAYTTGGNLPSSPVVANGVVYIGSDDKTVYALDATTGTKKWANYIDAGGGCSLVVTDGVVYVSSGHNVYALDAATGTNRWTCTTGGLVDRSPTVVGGVVYVSSVDKNVYALDAATGARKWAYTTGGNVYSSPAVADGLVYAGSTDKNVYALDAASGARKWAYTTGGIVESSPAVASGVVYISGGDNNVYALDAATGARKWAYTTGGRGLCPSPAVAGGVVYISSDDNNVYALDAATGARKWAYTTGGNGLLSTPTVAGGVVYVGGADDKNVYALDAATGAVVK